MSKSKFSGYIISASLNQRDQMKVSFVDHKMLNDDVANNSLKGGWDQEVSKDMKLHLNFLKGHAAITAHLFPKGKNVKEDYVQKRECVNDTDLVSYEVRGFEYKGSEETKSVILHMRRHLPDGQHYDFKLPKIKFGEGSDYAYADILEDDLADCEVEVGRYLDGKFNDNGQMKLEIMDKEEVEEEDY